jgi:hypothetical protein
VDKRGYDAIVSALGDVAERHGFENAVFEVSPIPEGEENVRYVSVHTNYRIPPALMLNALDTAGLMHRQERVPSRRSMGAVALLPVASADSNTLTFEDLKPRLPAA